MVRPAEQITSGRSKPGDHFRGQLAHPLQFHGGAVPAGSAVVGNVIAARPSGRVKGRAQLSLDLREIEFEGGWHALETDAVYIEAQGSMQRDTKTVAIGTAVGGVVGGLLGGKGGVAKGAAVGATAGTAGVLATKGLEVEIDAESVLYFTLRNNLELQVGPSQTTPLP